MNCEAVQDLLVAYSMHQLSDPIRAHVDRHIASCTVCACMLEDVLAMASIWADGCTNAKLLELDLVTPVMVEIHKRTTPAIQKPARRIIRLRTTFYHYGLAASFALVMLHFGVFNHMGTGLIHAGSLISGKVHGLFALADYL